jgi:hypothetical protein
MRTRSCGPPPKQGGRRSRRCSGPGSRGTPAAVALACRVLGAPRLPGVRPPPAAGAGPFWAGHLDQRPRPATADPPGAGRLPVRWRGLPQGPGPAGSRARHPGQRQRVLRLLRREGRWPTTSPGGAGRGRMTARSFLRGRTSAGAPTPRRPGPGLTAGVGVLVVDHSSAEAWAHPAKAGDRFAARAAGRRRGRRPLGPPRRRRSPRPGAAARRRPRTARPLHRLELLAGHRRRRRVLGEPEANGCAERWIRTPKQQCSWAESHDAIDQLRQAVAGFVDRYDSSWLIGRHGHQTRRRPIRQLKRPQRHDQVGTTSLQETGRCSERIA